MKRLIKILLSLLVGTITLLLIGILIIVFIVDPNDYKPQIADFVADTTGRTLTIEGDISLTFYPGLGLDLGKVSLGNAPGFAEPEFAKINQAQVLIKLLPLLRKQIEVDTVLLEGAQITLTRKADGTTNWDDLAALGGEKPDQEEKSTTFELKLDGLDLRQAEIVWDDQQTRARYVISDVNLNTSAVDLNLATLVLNKPVQLQLNTALDISGDTRLRGQVELNTQVLINQATQHYRLEPLQFSTTVMGNQIPGGMQTVSINSQVVDVDLKQQSLTLEGLVVKIMEGLLTGDIQAQNILTNPALSGSLKLADFNLQKLLKQLNLHAALPSDKVLKTLGGQTQFKANTAGILLTNLQLLVDDNQLKTPQLYVDLDKQTLNADALSLQAFGININSQLSLKQLFNQPTVDGKLVLAPFNPRQLLQRLEQAQLLPALALPDDKALPLKTAALETQFQVRQGTNVSLKNLNLRLDDNQLKTPQLQLDLDKQTLNADALTLKALGINLDGQLNIKQLLSKPTVSGQVSLTSANLRTALKRLEQAQLLPPQSVPDEKLLPLKTASLNTQFQVREANDIRLKQLDLRLDDNQLKTAQLQLDLDKQTLNADALTLKALGINLDGQLNLKQLLSKPTVSGQVSLTSANLRTALKRLEQAQLLPPQSVPDDKLLPLKTAALNTQFQVRETTNVRLENFHLRLDDNQLKTAQFQLDLNKQTLNLDALSLQAFGMRLFGRLNAKQILGQPTMNGQLSLTSANLRTALKRLEQTQLLPSLPLPDDKLLPLKTAALETQFHVHKANDLRFKQLNLRLDDNQLKTPQLRVDFNTQTLNADALTLKALGVYLNGQLNIKQLGSKPTVSGQVTLTSTNLRTALKRLEQAQLLPPQSVPDKKLLRLRKVSLNTQFDVREANDIRLKQLNLRLDDNQLKTAQFQLDLNKQTLNLDALSLQAFGMRLFGRLNAKQILGQPTMNGQLSLTSANLRTALKRLEQTQLLPSLPLPDDKLLPLKKATLETQFHVHKANDLRFKQLNLRLDNNQLKTPKLRVDLNTQTVDLATFTAQALGSHITLKIQAKQILSGATVQAELAATLNPQTLLKRLGQAPLELPAPLTLTRARLQTHVNLTPKNLTIKGLNLTVDKNQLTSKRINFNIAKDTLTTKNFRLKVLGIATLNGNLYAKRVSTQPTLQSALKIAAFSPRRLLQRLGQPIETSDPTVLNTLALETQLQGGLSQLNLNNLKIRLDNSQLHGNLRVLDVQQQALAFNLNVDQIDIDRYLPPESEEPETSQPDSPPLSGEAILLPLDMLRALNLNGTLKVGQLKAAGMEINDIHLNVSAKQGKIRLRPRAALYNGTYQGNLALDAQNTPPRVNLNDNRLTQVQASPLLMDLVGDDKVSGTTNLSAQLTAEASTLARLKNTLAGTIRFSFLDGTLKGFNLGYTLRQARSLIKRQPAPKPEAKQTDFASLRGSFVAQNGILYNEDLELKSPLLRVNGRGNIAMNSQQLHFILNTAVVDTTKGQGGKELEELKGIIIPVNVTGKLDAPTAQLDAHALETHLLQQAQAAAAAKLEREKQKLLEKHKDDLGEPVRRFLDDLRLEDLLR
jgi:uncharacterized protein involved in outer membrane biogenesis